MNKQHFTYYMPQQLNTFKSSIQRFPIHPINAYNKYLADPINTLVDSYHNKQWIMLEDNIQYQNDQEYLKRFYKNSQFANKIKLLGEYYRFHFEAPRLFMEVIGRIVENNIDQKRAIQYALVTKQISNGDANTHHTAINTCRAIQHNQRMIKDVQLSYEDFEIRRPARKQTAELKKFEEQHTHKNNVTSRNKQNLFKTQRALNRVDSVSSKGQILVFKPRNHGLQKNQNLKKNHMEPKYKKPKDQKKVKKFNSKKQGTQRSKMVSKVASNNNSLTSSHQGLSRSKSKAQLHVVNHKKFEYANNDSIKNSICETQKNIRSTNNNSQQNSMVKSLSKKQILGERKNVCGNLSRKASKADLKQQKSSYENLKQQKNSNLLLNYQTNPKDQKRNDQQCQKTHKMELTKRKPSLSNLETVPKKMFNRALELKKKKV